MSQRLKLPQLEYFRVVGRTQHMTRAAEELGVSQPALSRSIASLEREVGLPLFSRHGRSIRLNSNGNLFLGHVERAFRNIEDGLQELNDLNDVDSGTVSIGFLRSLGQNFIPQVVRRFKDKHHDSQIEFFQANSFELESELKRGRLDLIFVARIEDSGTISWSELGSQEIHLIVPLSHKFANRDAIELIEVKDEEFVAFKSGHAFRDLEDGVFRAAGFRPRISYECDDGNYLMNFVAAGLGIALTPPDLIVAEGFRTLNLSAPDARRAIGIAWQHDRYLNKSAQAFLAFARAAILPDMTVVTPD